MYTVVKLLEIRRTPKKTMRNPKAFHESKVIPLGLVEDDEYLSRLKEWEDLPKSGEQEHPEGIDVYERKACIFEHGAELIRSSFLDGEEYFANYQVTWCFRKAVAAEVKFI